MCCGSCERKGGGAAATAPPLSKVRMLAAVIALVAAILPLSAFGGGSDDIDGAVIDRTKTRSGCRYYQEFVARWEPPPVSPAHIVAVEESVSPQWGSFVIVKVNDVTVFRGLLSTRAADITAKAAQGVEAADAYLFSAAISGGTKTEDLSGSGLR